MKYNQNNRILPKKAKKRRSFDRLKRLGGEIRIMHFELYDVFLIPWSIRKPLKYKDCNILHFIFYYVYAVLFGVKIGVFGVKIGVEILP